MSLKWTQYVPSRPGTYVDTCMYSMYIMTTVSNRLTQILYVQSSATGVLS